MFSSEWKTATIDYDRTTTEFTGDDADQYTDLVDLEDIYEFITVLIPALDTSGIVTPYIQKGGSTATIPVAVNALSNTATGSYAHATTSGAGSIAVIFRIGAQHLRLRVSENQGANRVFYVRGFNRLTQGT